jgi:cytidylate kinase
MSQNSGELLAIYIEGETKTGKGAASEAIANALKAQGVSIYYDVAGDFFRRYVAIIRRQLKLKETDDLPARVELEAAATALYENGEAFSVDSALGDLQRPAISRSVSLLGELPIAQKAAVDWYAQAVKQAAAAGAQVMVLDGRNPRRHVEEHVRVPGVTTKTILDIYMTCEPVVAAARVLTGTGVDHPTVEQLALIVENIAQRRALDRSRAEWPFWWPETHVSFVPGEQLARQAVATSWQSEPAPLPIVIDNSYVPKQTMWTAVAELATFALAQKFE